MSTHGQYENGRWELVLCCISEVFSWKVVDVIAVEVSGHREARSFRYGIHGRVYKLIKKHTCIKSGTVKT